MKARNGISLIELLCALAIGSLSLLIGHATLVTAFDSSTRLHQRVDELLTDSQGHHQFGQLLLMATAPSERSAPFFGDSTSMHFSTLCSHAAGWLEACRVLVSVAREGRRSVLRLFSPHRGWSVLVAADSLITLRYWDAESDAWVSNWGPRRIVPDAVAFVQGVDTIVLPTRIR